MYISLWPQKKCNVNEGAPFLSHPARWADQSLKRSGMTPWPDLKMGYPFCHGSHSKDNFDVLKQPCDFGIIPRMEFKYQMWDMKIQTGTMWKTHKIFFKTCNLWGAKSLKMPALKRPRLCPFCPSKPSWPASDRPVPPGPERLWFFALWPQGHQKCNGKLMENDGNSQIAHQRLDERYQDIKGWWTVAVFSGNQRWYPTAGLDATCVNELHSFKPSSTHDSVYILTSWIMNPSHEYHILYPLVI